MVIGAVVSGGFRELNDVSDLQVAELYTLDGVAVALLTVAQIRLVVTVTVTLAAEDVNNTGLVIDTGGNIGRVP